MRKLTVKNFSVIKDAELEFGKITVLIGPQSSGKSLLCKLAYFLGKGILDIAVGRVLNDFSFLAFEAAVKKEFVEWFPMGGWGSANWSVQLVLDDYSVSIAAFGDGPQALSDLTVEFGENFKNIYEDQHGNSRPWMKSVIYIAFSRLMGKGVWDVATYIPSERPYYVDTNKGYRFLASEPDPIAKRFAESYSNSLDVDIAKPRLSSLLKGEPKRGGNSWLFVFDDGRILPLSHLSSGSKQLFALFSVLETYEKQRPETMAGIHEGYSPPESVCYDEFFIEEPEADIFPETQYELVRYFAELAKNRDLKPTFTITTHSPYILSAFGNLLKAGKVGAQSAEHHAAVEKTVAEKYWIKNSDFAAYKIENGVLISIFDKDTGQIDGDYLDDVSTDIAEEFGQLLEIQYGG